MPSTTPFRGRLVLDRRWHAEGVSGCPVECIGARVSADYLKAQPSEGRLQLWRVLEPGLLDGAADVERQVAESVAEGELGGDVQDDARRRG
jgi:hypothetical protein